MMKKLITLSIITCCCVVQSALGQFNVIGSDEYGRVFNLTYDAVTPNKVYASTLGNHIVVSEDNGNEWDILYAFPESSTTIEGLRMVGENTLSFYLQFSGAPATQRSVYMLDLNSLTISKQFTTPVPNPNAENSWVGSYSIYKHNTDIVLVDLNYKIGVSNYSKAYYSTDGGNSWQVVYDTTNNLNIFINNVAISPIDSQKLFLARGQGNSGAIGGILISNDGGNTWTEKIDGVTLHPIAFHPNNADEIYVGSSIGFGSHDQNLYRSVDGGQNWSIVPINWTDSILNNINVIAFNPSNPDDIIILEENEIVLSNDGGSTWQNYVYLDEGDVHSYYYGLGASFNPFEDDEIFISANYHALFSDDGGETVTWSKNPYFVSTGNVNYVEINDEEHVYYGVQFGYVHRDMATEEENAYEIMPLNYVSNSPGTTVYADANVLGRVYSFSGGFLGSDLAVSDNHGEAPEMVFNTFLNTFHTVASHPTNPNIIWASFSSFGENPELYEIDFSDLSNIQTTLIDLPETDIVTAIHFDQNNPDHMMLAVGTWIYKSTDGGNTWSQSSEGLDNLIAFEDLILKMTQNPLDENQFTLATNRGIYTSLDSGETWNQNYTSLMHNVAHSTETNGHMVATVHNSNISTFSILYSTDGGENWDEVASEDIWHIASSASTFKFNDESAEIYIGSSDLGLVKYTVDLSEMSIPGFAQNKIASVYPNPASDRFNVQLENGETLQRVSVYTMTGQKLMSTRQKHVDVANLKTGIYLVEISTVSGKTTTQKLVKK